MEWFDKIWSWASSRIGDFIHNSSAWTFVKVALGALIVLAAIGIVIFWHWLINKALNHGGNH